MKTTISPFIFANFKIAHERTMSVNSLTNELTLFFVWVPLSFLLQGYLYLFSCKAPLSYLLEGYLNFLLEGFLYFAVGVLLSFLLQRYLYLFIRGTFTIFAVRIPLFFVVGYLYLFCCGGTLIFFCCRSIFIFCCCSLPLSFLLQRYRYCLLLQGYPYLFCCRDTVIFFPVGVLYLFFFFMQGYLYLLKWVLAPLFCSCEY